ncbi:hypothetical protein Peur_072035 [Populus x canadensis]
MGSSSKDLLHLENKYFSTPSSLESILRVCDKDSGPKKPPTDEKPLTSPGPRSQGSQRFYNEAICMDACMSFG